MTFLIAMSIAGSICSMAMFAHATAIRISTSGTDITLEAQNVPLVEVLKAMAEKVGFNLKTGDALRETISCTLRERSVEDAIKHLMTNHSYTLTYRKTDEGDFVPDELCILADAQPQPKTAFPYVPPVDPPTPDEMRLFRKQPPSPQKIERSWFAEHFNRSRWSSEQIAASPIEAESGVQGILITDVPEASALKNLGLEPGDIIQNIDGHLMHSSEEFLRTLSSIQDGQPLVRIDRFRENLPLPIYIELQ